MSEQSFDRYVDLQQHRERMQSPVSERMLWLGVLLAPVAWAGTLLVGYPLTGAPCSAGQAVGLIGITGLGVVAAVAGVLVARRSLHALRDAPAPAASGREDERDAGVVAEREDSTLSAPPEMPHRTANDRRRLMAHGGMILGLLSVAIIAGHAIALLVFGPCA